MEKRRVLVLVIYIYRRFVSLRAINWLIFALFFFTRIVFICVTNLAWWAYGNIRVTLEAYGLCGEVRIRIRHGCIYIFGEIMKRDVF